MIATIQKYLLTNRIKKRGKEILRHANHIRNNNEDIAAKPDLVSLEKAESDLILAVKKADLADMEIAAKAVFSASAKLVPRKRFSALRENLEVLLVAIAVAMGIRTYFIQPFKIPTGSMQPTLYGIHGFEMDAPGITDKVPLNLVRWLVTGEKYRDVRVKQAGRLQVNERSAKPGLIECRVGPYSYYIPTSSAIRMMHGQMLPTGTILWRGRQKVGDHVFVNKVAWNFVKPQRGDVMVFSTEGIEALEADFPKDRKGQAISTHYIKRMCGLPTESIGINRPHLVVGVEEIEKPESIARVTAAKNGYSGYKLASSENPFLADPEDRIHLAKDEYLAFGDNTENSKDSRYWGAVPERNLVGPAFMVYWPYSKERWGLIQGH